jgi:hypothetical protein
MSPLLLLAGAVVVAAAVVAVSARDGRSALGALAVALSGSALLADPLPDFLTVATRVLAAILATYLLWIPVRDGPRVARGSLVGWPVEALAATAGFVIGAGTHGLGVPGQGAAAAQAAAFALAALAVLPAGVDRDPLRMGIGLMLLVHAAVLMRTGLAGTALPLEQLVSAGLTVGLAAAIAIVRSAHDVAFADDGSVPPGARATGAAPLSRPAARRGTAVEP